MFTAEFLLSCFFGFILVNLQSFNMIYRYREWQFFFSTANKKCSRIVRVYSGLKGTLPF
jgi:hypothetical protein